MRISDWSSDVCSSDLFELAYQQVFDFLPGFLSGLGVQANYTFVDSSGVPQSTLSATDPDVAAGRVPTIAGESFPLQGLSKHQVNVKIGRASRREIACQYV